SLLGVAGGVEAPTYADLYSGVWTHPTLAMEDGPGNLIVALRRRLGDGFFGNMIDCFNCLSLWIAALIACLFANTWREWPLLWLGLSGAACLLERLGGQPIIMRP